MIFKIIKFISAILFLTVIAYALVFFSLIIQLKTNFSDTKNDVIPKIEESLKQEKKNKSEKKIQHKITDPVAKQQQNDLSKFKVLKREETPDSRSVENTDDYSSNDSYHNDNESIPDDNELEDQSIDLEKEKSYNFNEPSNNEKPAQSDKCDDLETEAEYERCMEQNFE